MAIVHAALLCQDEAKTSPSMAIRTPSVPACTTACRTVELRAMRMPISRFFWATMFATGS